MPVVIYTGDVGSGKTVAMIRELNGLKNSNILSNMKLNKKIFKNVKDLTIEDIQNYKKWEYNNMTVVLDEIHTLLDSRKSGTDLNTMLSYWFTQSRKRKVNILGTTQFFHQLEKRVRYVSDFIVECNCYQSYNKNSKYKNDDGILTDFWIIFTFYHNYYNIKTKMFFIIHFYIFLLLFNINILFIISCKQLLS